MSLILSEVMNCTFTRARLHPAAAVGALVSPRSQGKGIAVAERQSGRSEGEDTSTPPAALRGVRGTGLGIAFVALTLNSGKS